MIKQQSVPLGDKPATDRRPPLKQIADLLGVSKMTVSRALREGTFVETQLRARIQETARQIGYQADSRISQVMSAIRKSQSPHYRETLALVWTHQAMKNKASNCFLEEIRSGAQLQAQQHGYKLDEFSLTDEAMNGRTLSRILYSRGIRGVLVAPPGLERSYPHLWLDWKKFCCVLIGRSYVNTGISRVQPDHYFACVLAVRRLKRLRYQRIGLVMSRSFDEQTDHLVRSAFRSFHPLGPKEAEKLVFTSDRSDPKAQAKWLTLTRPDVIITNFEDTFPRLEQFTSRTGRSIDLVALSWNRQQPNIAGVNLQLPLVGEHAVDLLLQRVQRNLFGLEDTAPTIHVPGTWMDGSSIRQAPFCNGGSKGENGTIFTLAAGTSRCE